MQRKTLPVENEAQKTALEKALAGQLEEFDYVRTQADWGIFPDDDLEYKVVESLHSHVSRLTVPGTIEISGTGIQLTEEALGMVARIDMPENVEAGHLLAILENDQGYVMSPR